MIFVKPTIHTSHLKQWNIVKIENNILPHRNTKQIISSVKMLNLNTKK